MLEECPRSRCSRRYLSRVLKALDALEPGGLCVLPCAVGDTPIMFVVQRNRTPREHTCSLTVVSCDPEMLTYHRASAEPPKLKFATCLTLTAIELKRARHAHAH